MGKTIIQADITLQQIERIFINFSEGRPTAITVNYYAADVQGQRLDQGGYSRRFDVSLTDEAMATLGEAERQGIESFLGFVKGLLLPAINQQEERQATVGV